MKKQILTLQERVCLLEDRLNALKVRERHSEIEMIPARELNDLNDVVIDSPSNGESLKYNSTSGKWENTA